jgi:uncharacterized protein (UPF0548 family)
MLSLRRPTPARIEAFLARQAGLDLTYTAVGATSGTPPSGYAVNHTRVLLGQGEQVFAAARAALERWLQFRVGWIETWPAGAPLRVGQVVAVAARNLGHWWLNACRIVAVVDDDGPTPRFGFAYGTLPAHAGSGEERFLVEWDRATGEVWYDLFAFSRPRHLLARLGAFWMRRVQRRFGRESAAAMIAAARASIHATGELSV